MGIGERIKQLRGPLLQEEFAKKISVSKSTIGRFEREERRPDIEDLNKILAAYPYIHPAWLLTGEEPMERSKQTIDQKDIPLSDRELHVLIYEAVDKVAEVLGHEEKHISTKDKAFLASELFRIFSKDAARQYVTKETMLEQAVLLWVLIGNRERVDLFLNKMGLTPTDDAYTDVQEFLAVRDLLEQSKKN